MAEEQTEVSAKSLYEKLNQNRQPYLTRARRAAELTVPSLFPAEGTSGSTALPDNSQSLGARGVRHLASKMNNSLFPPNHPFFKTDIDDISIAKLNEESQGQFEQNRGEFEKALSARERAIMSEINASLFRPVSFEAQRHLIVGGNYMLHIPKDGNPRGFRLDNYVVDRDASGNLLDAVVEEKLARAALPAEVMNLIETDKADQSREKDLYLYTHIHLMDDGKYSVVQEINGKKVSEPKVYPKEALEWIPLRFSYVEGEDYGRSFVDEYVGDLSTLEKLTKAVRDATIQGTKIVWMVAPNASVNPKKLASAENGSFVQGRPEDVRPLQLEKYQDLRVAAEQIAKLRQSLSEAFLLHSAIQRDGERVTAEEIRYMAQELDQAIGGVYSLMSEEFQMPVARLYAKRMEAKKGVPPLPEGITNVSVVTGLEALGRGNDLQNLDAFLAGAIQTVGIEAVAQRINIGEYFSRRAAALGIDSNGLVKTDQQLQQEAEAAQQQAMMQQGLPAAINQAGGMMKQQMANEAEQGEPTNE